MLSWCYVITTVRIVCVFQTFDIICRFIICFKLVDGVKVSINHTFIRIKCLILSYVSSVTWCWICLVGVGFYWYFCVIWIRWNVEISECRNCVSLRLIFFLRVSLECFWLFELLDSLILVVVPICILLSLIWLWFYVVSDKNLCLLNVWHSLPIHHLFQTCWWYMGIHQPCIHKNQAYVWYCRKFPQPLLKFFSGLHWMKCWNPGMPELCDFDFDLLTISITDNIYTKKAQEYGLL